MTNPTPDEYKIRAKMYRLLDTLLQPGPEHSVALDDTLKDPDLRAILSAVVGVAFGSYILKYGNPTDALAVIKRERNAAEDLAGLGDDGGSNR